MSIAQARTWWMEMARGLLGIAFGVLWIILREHAIRAVLIVLGIFLIVDGVADLISLYRGRRHSRYRWLDFVLSGGSVVLGVISIIEPLLTLIIVVVVLAVRLIAQGIAQLREARRVVTSQPGWSWLYGVGFIVGGVLLLALPHVTLAFILIFIPAYAIVDGLVLFTQGLLLKFAPARILATPVHPDGPFGDLPDDAPGMRRAIVFARRSGANGFGHIAWAFEWRNGWFNAGSVENRAGKPIAKPDVMDFWSTHTLNPIQAVQAQPFPYDECKIFYISDPQPKHAWKTVVWTSRVPYSLVRHNCMDVAYEILHAFGVQGMLDPAAEYVPNDWFDALPGPSYALTPDGQIALHLRRMSSRPLSVEQIALHIPPTVPGEPPEWRMGTHRAWSELLHTWDKMLQDVQALFRPKPAA